MVNKTLRRLLISVLLIGACGAAHAELREDFKRDSALQRVVLRTMTNSRLLVAAVHYETPILASRGFADLSEEDRAIWRNLNYDNMPEGDAFPFPVGGLLELLRPIAVKNMEEELEGEVIVHVEIDSQGNVRGADLYAAPSKEFGKFVVNSVSHAVYSPARCNGQACVMTLPLRITLSHKSYR